MVSSMTGYGRGEVTRKGMTAVAEVRSVNSRFLEVVARLPRSLGLRENDVKELIRKKIIRGKINIVVTLEHDDAGALPLRVNTEAAKMSYRLLKDIQKATRISEKITLEHLLKFSEILEPPDNDQNDEKEWGVVQSAIDKAVDDLMKMRFKEGGELTSDVLQRIKELEKNLNDIETLGKKRMPEERTRIRERIAALLDDKSVIDEHRLELELALLADKIDVTEECVRFRSHVKFFVEALKHDEAAGRKLNFLLQEMNREANTIGSKSLDATISQKVVMMKDELEKIREQLQNIE